MIEIQILIFVGVYLLAMALIDIKHKKIPAVFSTSLILILAIYTITKGYPLTLGLLAFIFAYLLYDFDYFKGVADIKSIVIIGLVLINLKQFFGFMLLTVVIGFLYQIFLIKFLKYKDKKDEIPFLPVFFIIYTILMLLIYAF